MPPRKVPASVERYFVETKLASPHYTDAQAWAVAWSRFCRKHPTSKHCHQTKYFGKPVKRKPKLRRNFLEGGKGGGGPKGERYIVTHTVGDQIIERSQREFTTFEKAAEYAIVGAFASGVDQSFVAEFVDGKLVDSAFILIKDIDPGDKEWDESLPSVAVIFVEEDHAVIAEMTNMADACAMAIDESRGSGDKAVTIVQSRGGKPVLVLSIAAWGPEEKF